MQKKGIFEVKVETENEINTLYLGEFRVNQTLKK